MNMDLGFSMSSGTVTTLVTVFIVYSIIVVGLGAFVKFSQKGTSEASKLKDYLTGGGALGPLAVGMLTFQLVEHDLCALIFVEGSISHVYDYFKELAENRILLLFEQDDPAEIKKTLPNVCPAGGYPTDYLKGRSINECLDKAKEMLDTMAYDGRWVYAFSKMLSYKNDANPENILAVNNYLRENGVF